jgi:drug/metabolite transporter (DMT)-like permease
MLSNTAKVSPMTQAILLTGTASVFSLVISPFFGGISTHGLSGVWGIALLMVLAQAFGNILFFKGLSELEAGVTAIALSSILLWGTVLSVIFLHSTFSLTQVIGIVLLFMAIIGVQYKKGSRRIETPVLYIVGSALLFAVFQVCSAELAKAVPTATYLILNFGGATVVVLLFYRKRVHKDIKTLKPHKVQVTKVVIASVMCSMGYFIFSYFAYKHAPDRGIVIVLLTSQVVLSVILGAIFLKERGHLNRKLGAGVLALIAGILIKS